METTPPPLPPQPVKATRRNATTFKLLLIAALVLLLQAPLHLVGMLQQERLTNIMKSGRAWADNGATDADRAAAEAATQVSPEKMANPAFEPYRVVVRALKHNILVLVLVFTAFFLFETLCGLRLHAIHYGLVGAALCLFYLALLALGEVMAPGLAYLTAAGASSVLITFYSAAILRGRDRAAVIGGLLICVHGMLYVVLHMQNFALLAGTATLFAALAAVMYFTRNIDWHGSDEGKEVTA